MVDIRYWQDLTGPELAALAGERCVAVLPVGAVEQHGPHLPLGTDTLIAEGILSAALERLDAEATVVVLPTQAIGDSVEHSDFAGTLSHEVETLIASWYEIGASLARSGVTKLVVFNGHGGQPQIVDIVAQRLRARHAMLVVRASYLAWPTPKGAVADDELKYGIHGGLLETSLMLHLHPGLVRTDKLADFPSRARELAHRHRRFGHGGRLGFAWQAQDLAREGVAGNAAGATAKIGERLVGHYAGILAELIADAATFSLSDLHSV